MSREAHVRSLWGAGGESPPAYPAQGRVAAALTLDLKFGGRLANRVAAWRSRWGDPSPFFATDCWHVQPAVAA